MLFGLVTESLRQPTGKDKKLESRLWLCVNPPSLIREGMSGCTHAVVGKWRVLVLISPHLSLIYH